MQLLPNTSTVCQSVMAFCIFEDIITSDNLYFSPLRFCRQQVQRLHRLLGQVNTCSKLGKVTSAGHVASSEASSDSYIMLQQALTATL